MRRFFCIVLSIVYSVWLVGCSEPTEEYWHLENVGRQASGHQITKSETMEMTESEPTVEQEIPDYGYLQMQDMEVDYLSGEDWKGICVKHPFICWQDMLMIGNTVYRREDGIYRKTKESLQDRLNLEDDLVCFGFTQWENLLVVYRDNQISVFNSDFEQLASHTFDGYIDCVFQGKVYYRDQNWTGLFCMDILSGEVDVIYDGEGASYFMVRNNGDMILSVINGTVEDGRIWEYWFLSYDEQGELKADKIWETDKYKYKYMEMWEFNDRGLFLIGECYSNRGDTLCLCDNGEIEEIMETNSWVPEGQIITEEGYFQWDSQILSEEEKEEILGSWGWNRPREAETVVDSISYYDFQDNRLGTWQLIDDEILEIGYRLAAIVYCNGEFIALYENEEFADLYISKVQVQ